MDYEAMGRRIKAARLAKSLNQRELASAAGLSVSALQAIEKGNENVRLEAVVRLAEALNVPLDTVVNPLIQSEEMTAQTITQAEDKLRIAQMQIEEAAELLETCHGELKIRWTKLMNQE